MTDALDKLCLTADECAALAVIASEWRVRSRDRAREQSAALKRIAERATLHGRESTQAWASINGEQAAKFNNYADFLSALAEKYGPPENVFKSGEAA
jgi:hypothetical protein